jgi:enoyl-CoA hydratase/carnithine racemase
MTYETLKYEVADKVLTITLNRPDRLNAFTGQMMLDLIKAFDAADADDNVRAIIITGEGRGFCAGADLAAGADTFNYDERTDRPDREGGMVGTPDRDGGGRVTLRIFDSIKPVIGAINGPAVGIGVTMQLPMDIRIASDKARFGFVFSRRGICPEACSSWFLPRLVGIQQALDWTFSGRVFDAAEALAGGLVKEVVPHDQLLARANEIAREIADNTSAVSVALSRQLMWKMLGADHPMEAHKIDSRGIYELGKGSDVKEGVVSFLEKRPPNFTDSPTKDMPDFYPWWDERDYT